MSEDLRQVGRLAKIEGQVRGISRMIQQDRDCRDVLIAIRAARAALLAVSRNLAQSEVETLMSRAGQMDAPEPMVRDALRILKYSC